MKLSDIDDSVKITDLDGFFDIYEDSNKNYYYNLNSTLYINVPESRLLKYKLSSNLFWTTISYQLYGTTRLWWLLMKLNKVEGIKIFDSVKAGDEILYMSNDDIKQYIIPTLLDTED